MYEVLTSETRRQQIVQFLGELIGADPTQMAIIGDMLWKYLDVPEHTQIEERYKLMLAPPIQQLIAGNSPLPPEAMQKIAMLEQQLAELAPLADKNQADLQKTELQQSQENEREKARLATEREIKFRELEVKERIEMMKLGNAQMMARAEHEQELLHQHGEVMVAREERDANAQEANLDRQAERDAKLDDMAFQSGEADKDRATQADLAAQKAAQPSA